MQIFNHRCTHLAVIALTLLAALTEQTTAQPQLTLSASDTTLTRGDSATITVSVPAGQEPASDLTVNFSFAGSAFHSTFFGDYYMAVSTVISAGQSSATSALATFNSSPPYWIPDQTAIIKASASGYADSGSLTITITDPDPIPLTLTATGNTVSEGNQIQITVSVPTGGEPENDLGFVLSTGGSAERPADYTFNSPGILAGQRSASTTLQTLTDRRTEGEETIRLKLSAAGYTDTLWLEITLEDRPYLALRASDTSVAEPSGTTTLTVSVPAGAEPSSELTVTFAHSGSASAGSDYTVGALTIAAGQSTGSSTLSVVDDAAAEGDETITLRAGAAGYTVSAWLTLVLQDDDAAPLTLTAAANMVSEPSGTTTFTVSVPAGAEPSSELTVTLAHSGSAAHPGDYTVGALTIAAGQSTGSATLSVVDDAAEEEDETITLRASAAGYSGSASLTLVLQDDDAAPLTLTAPEAPRNLTAVGGNGQVVLTWDAPKDDGGSAVRDYEYRIGESGAWTSTGSTRTTYTVTGLDNGTAYVFQVRAVNRRGKGRVSNRAEATTTLTVLDFTHFANGTGITSEMVFVNMASHPMHPALYFYDQGGDLVDPGLVVDVMGNDLEIREDGSLRVREEMEPLGVLTIATHGQGDLVSGSVRVVTNGPIGGFVRYSVPGVGVAGVGASPAVRDALFPAHWQEGGIRTAAALHNLGEEAIVVSCRLMQEGAVLQETEIPLEANGQTSWFIDEAFPAADTSAFVGSAHCDVPGRRRFTAIAVEMDVGQRIFTALPVVTADRTGGGGRETVLDFAHFVNGTGVTSDFVFVNESTQPSGPPRSPFHPAIPPSRPALYFYDQGGDPIDPASVVDLTGDLEVREDGSLTVRAEMEPLGVLTIATHGRGELVSGSVKVVSSGPLGGMLRYNLPEVGVGVAGSSPPLSAALFPVRRQEGGINTGVAVHNLGEEAMEVTCELMQEGVLADDVSIPLAANGQSSWFIDEVFTGADTSDFVGSVRCTAPGEGMFTGVAVELDAANRIFTTLPVVPVPERPDRE